MSPTDAYHDRPPKWPAAMIASSRLTPAGQLVSDHAAGLWECAMFDLAADTALPAVCLSQAQLVAGVDTAS